MNRTWMTSFLTTSTLMMAAFIGYSSFSTLKGSSTSQVSDNYRFVSQDTLKTLTPGASLQDQPVAILPSSLNQLDPNQNNQPKPSFRCRQASLWAEHQICADAELAALDVQIADRYQERLTQASEVEKPVIRREQLQWLQTRNACEIDSEPNTCLTTQLNARIQTLAEQQSITEETITEETVKVTRGEIVWVESKALHPEKPVITFQLIDQPQISGQINQIDIYCADDPEPFQQISLSESPQVLVEQSFVIEDMNFDGYQDIRLLKQIPIGANAAYSYWVFDPQTREFVAAPELEQITSPTFDHSNQRIISHNRMSAGTHLVETYEYFNNELTLMESERTQYIQPDLHVVTRLSRNSPYEELQLIEQTVLDN